ncbi:MAG: HAD family phosphatase [Rhizobiaceae bacterium]|nr:HAD family phosphatase [Rhizobiaceae bacterium]
MGYDSKGSVVPEIQLVIFDCDGVLIDSEIVAAAAELEVYSEFGVEMDIHEFSQRMAGLSAHDVRKAIETDLGMELPDRVIPETRKLVNEKVIAEAQLIPGADTVLDLLDQARCICSNSPPERLKQVLTRVGLHDKFRPYVFSAQEVDPPLFKPRPDIFLKALKEFEVSPQDTIVVEDSVPGVEGARRAGCRVIGFTGATHSYRGHSDQLIDAGAETVISRMGDLPGVVEAFGHWSGVI